MRLACGLLIFTLGVLVSAPAPVCGAETATPAPNSRTGSQPAAGQKNELNVKDGKLSVQGRFPLGRITEELTEKAGVAIVMTNDLGTAIVSGDFKDLPVDEGLRRILKKQDVFFFYGVDEDQPSTLKAVWIYAKGRGRGLAPVPPDKWGSTSDLSRGLTDKDPAVRARAIDALVERKRAAAREAVLGALNDPASQVRAQALYAAFKSGVDIPPNVLNGMLHDSSGDVRFLALEALSNDAQARSVAQAALKDPDEAVRNEAQEIIAKLDEEAAKSQPGRQRVPTGQEGEEPR
jgi:hypothetical protein